MQCPFCKDEHPDEAEFCPITGQSLISFKNSAKTCARCGEFVPQGAQFCPICGEAIAGATSTRQSINSSFNSSITCTNCGGGVPPEAKFCPSCGTAVAQTTGVELGILQVLKLFKGNFIKLAGIGAIIIVVVLVIVTFTKSGPKDNSSKLPIAAQTQTSLPQHIAGSSSVQGNEYPTSIQTVLLSPLVNDPTITISPTKIPTRAPTEPERKTCGGAPPIRVDLGHTFLVTSNCGNHILMRLNPVVATNVEQYLYAGDELKILDGPQCSNDVAFFLAEAPKYSKTGWVAEAEPDSKIYCIEPAP